MAAQFDALSRLWNNSPRDLATAAAIAIGVLLVISVPVVMARRKFHSLESEKSRHLHLLLDLARRTSLLLLVLPAIYVGSRALTLSPQTESTLGMLARLCFIAQGGFWAIALIDFLMGSYEKRRLQSDPASVTTIRAFRFATLVATWALVVLMALDNTGVHITAIVTGLGIGGVAIALALQTILGDLFASLSIVLDKPFVVGDFIAVGSDVGNVQQIGLKTTRVRALSGEELVFANGELLKGRIHNFGRMYERRILFRIGVVYGTPASKLERIPVMVRDIIEGAQVRFDRGHFADFGDSSYDFEFVYFVPSADYNHYMDVQQQINLGIVSAFEKEAIEFAFPTRTVVLQNTPAGLLAEAEPPRAADQPKALRR